jgi:hypothetical protein
MVAAITARSGSATVVEAKTAVHIECTGLEANTTAGSGGSKTITANTLANPTVIASTAHGFETGDTVTIAGSNSTPTINGSRVVTKIDADHFSVPVNVTTAGTAGTAVFVSDSASRAAGTERRYYILVDAPAGVDDARSHVFQPSSDGKHTWDDYIFPADGSYTLRIRDMANDADIATASVTVEATS